MSASQSKGMQPIQMTSTAADQAVESHGADRTNLVAILQDIQELEGYVSPEALTQVAKRLDLPVIEVYSVARFYKALRLTPRGKHHVCVCLGTACHIRGGQRIVEHLERTFSVQRGGTTADRRFTLSTVNCVGACAVGPVVLVDGEYHGNMSPAQAEKMLRRLGEQAEVVGQ